MPELEGAKAQPRAAPSARARVANSSSSASTNASLSVVTDPRARLSRFIAGSSRHTREAKVDTVAERTHLHKALLPDDAGHHRQQAQQALDLHCKRFSTFSKSATARAQS